MTLDTESQRQRMDRDREEFSTKAQVDLRSKLSELNLRFDSRLKEMETSITETVTRQEESRRLQEIQVVNKQCEKDIETARADERRSRVREVDNLRSSFKERERATAEDLVHLEQLHTERLQRLEHQNQNLIKKIENAEHETAHAKDIATRGSVEVRLQASQHMQQAEEATRKAESLLLQSTSLRRELQESRVREGTYREQLNHALEENRLQRAEMLEAQKQAQAVASEALLWRKQAEQVDMTTSTSATTVQIAKDEINMLEHELLRVKEDNYVLQNSLIRAEKLVYGAPKAHIGAQGNPVRAEGAGVGVLGGHPYMRYNSPAFRSPATRPQSHPSTPGSGSGGKANLTRKPLVANPTFGTAATGRM